MTGSTGFVHVTVKRDEDIHDSSQCELQVLTFDALFFTLLVRKFPLERRF